MAKARRYPLQLIPERRGERGLMIKTTNGNAVQNPLVGTSNNTARDMVRFAGEFGLTPIVRARLALSAVAPLQKSKSDGLV